MLKNKTMRIPSRLACSAYPISAGQALSMLPEHVLHWPQTQARQSTAATLSIHRPRLPSGFAFTPVTVSTPAMHARGIAHAQQHQRPPRLGMTNWSAWRSGTAVILQSLAGSDRAVHFCTFPPRVHPSAGMRCFGDDRHGLHHTSELIARHLAECDA